MDLRDLLADLPSGTGKDFLIGEVVGSESNFKELLSLALHEKDPVAWRAAWLLDGSDEAKPGTAGKYIPGIARALPGLESRGSLRSLLRLLTRYPIPEEEQGLLIDLCFSYLVSELYPVAVKAHAMQIIYNHVLLYPELKNELITVIEDQAENNSVGFRARGKILIKQMEKL
jgi:hypothetical protein